MNATDIDKLLIPVVAAHGLEIDRVEVAAAGKRSVIRVFLDGDGPDGLGPSLDQIADATRSVSVALDDVDITRGRPYTLEVSSRGVGRPLTEQKHFHRNRGRLVMVATVDGQTTGRIVAADADGLRLDVDGAIEELSWPSVKSAAVQVELNRSIAEFGDEDEED